MAVKINGTSKRRMTIAETNALLRQEGQEPVKVKSLTKKQREIAKKNTLR